MKEDLYVKILDTFTWIIVSLLALYVLLWLVENYNVKFLSLENSADLDQPSTQPKEAVPQVAQPKAKKGDKKRK